jgi:hypothetical protein
MRGTAHLTPLWARALLPPPLATQRIPLATECVKAAFGKPIPIDHSNTHRHIVLRRRRSSGWMPEARGRDPQSQRSGRERRAAINGSGGEMKPETINPTVTGGSYDYQAMMLSSLAPQSSAALRPAWPDGQGHIAAVTEKRLCPRTYAEFPPLAFLPSSRRHGRTMVPREKPAAEATPFPCIRLQSTQFGDQAPMPSRRARRHLPIRAGVTAEPRTRRDLRHLARLHDYEARLYLHNP